MQAYPESNSYYYKFNPPSQKKATGPWKREEILNFLREVQRKGDTPWGAFSIKIIGRTGQQCND